MTRSGQSPRDVARRILFRATDGAYANLTLSGELDRAERLDEPDRRLVTHLVYGTLKWQRRLDHALAAYAPRGLSKLDPRTRDILRLGAFQLLHSRVPAHAAVDDAVTAVRLLRGERLGNFVNALLRRLAREGEPPLPPVAEPVTHLGVAESAPDWLVERLLGRWGFDDTQRLLRALNAPAPLWMRVNRKRAQAAEIERLVREEQPEAALGRSPLSTDALRFDEVVAPLSTRAFREGFVTVQDLAAQLVSLLVAPEPGELILDACGGVGGKSTHLAVLADDRAEIDAADLSARKLELSRDLSRRLGVTSVRHLECDLTDPKAVLRTDYHRVLIDAPCSGLGVLRRHPEAKWRRRPAEIAALVELQARLLGAVAPRVRPGGLLVYSVCTFTEEEGPKQIAQFLSRHPAFVCEPLPEALSSVGGAGGALETWPHRDDADAFYAVRLRRMR
jgi:16S rRNA (cytosine967-C5)-methyltransferase